jgi:hypothetical protein
MYVIIQSKNILVNIVILCESESSDALNASSESDGESENDVVTHCMRQIYNAMYTLLIK